MFQPGVRDRTEPAEPNRTEPNRTEPRRVRKTQAVSRRIGKLNFPNRTDELSKSPEPKRIEPNWFFPDVCSTAASSTAAVWNLGLPLWLTMPADGLCCGGGKVCALWGIALLRSRQGHELDVCPISLLRLSLLRLFDSNFPGNSLRT